MRQANVEAARSAFAAREHPHDHRTDGERTSLPATLPSRTLAHHQAAAPSGQRRLGQSHSLPHKHSNAKEEEREPEGKLATLGRSIKTFIHSIGRRGTSPQDAAVERKQGREAGGGKRDQPRVILAGGQTTIAASGGVLNVSRNVALMRVPGPGQQAQTGAEATAAGYDSNVLVVRESGAFFFPALLLLRGPS